MSKQNPAKDKKTLDKISKDEPFEELAVVLQNDYWPILKKNILENKDLIPIFSLVILGLSLAKIQIYYSYFSVNILAYISIAELFNQFIPEMMNLAFYGVVILLFVYGLFPLSKFLEPLLSKTGRIFPFIITVLIFQGIFVYIILGSGIVNFVWAAYAAVIFSFVWLINGILTKNKIHIISKNMMLLVTLLGTLLATSTLETWRIAYNFYETKALHDNYLRFENGKEVKPYKKTFLIGLTSDYAIFWNDSTGRAEAYSRSDIVEMEIGTLPITGNFISNQSKQEKKEHKKKVIEQQERVAHQAELEKKIDSLSRRQNIGITQMQRVGEDSIPLELQARNNSLEKIKEQYLKQLESFNDTTNQKSEK